ncbi:MAG: RHS repeat-associated core domain-containing protein [Planctomycetota bacterium]
MEITDGKPRVWPSGPMLEIGTNDGTDGLIPITDLTGSVIALTNGKGELLRSWDYDPFGPPRNPRAPSSPVEIPFGFAGGQFDPETGLVYFNARYYDPKSGRFLTPDPAPGQLTNPASLHPYQYAYNNPLRYIDTSGATAAEIADGISDAAGSAGASAGYGIGYGVSYLISAPVRGAYWLTGNTQGTARLDRAIDTFSRDVTGVAADTLASTVTTVAVDPLRIGSGLGTASVHAQQGEYGMAALHAVGDAARAIPIASSIGRGFRPAANFLSGTGSPPRLYSAQNNVDDILNSGRIWGQTEGSVYAGTNPRTDGLAGYLANTREPRPGDVAFIFEGQAASLFKPHEITGPFGLIKRLGGQHKGGFGDIQLNSWTRGANGEVIVTQAELLAGEHAGPALWGVFSKGQRLAGRRIFDATAAGVVGLSAADELSNQLEETFGNRGRQAGSKDPFEDLVSMLTEDELPEPSRDSQDDPPLDETLPDDTDLSENDIARARDAVRNAEVDLDASNRAGQLDGQLTEVERERQRQWEEEQNRLAQEEWVTGGDSHHGGRGNGADWVNGISTLINAINQATQGYHGGGHHH